MSNVTEVKFVRVMPIPDQVMTDFIKSKVETMDKFLDENGFSRTKPLAFECGYIKKGKFKPIQTETVDDSLNLFLEKIYEGDKEIVFCVAQEGAPGGRHVH